MGRPLRFVPEAGALVEVTVRTFQSRFLLRPSPALNEIIGGVLGRAQTLHPVRCHGAVFLSNHFHLLLSVDDALELAKFMGYLDSNLAREVNRLHGWTSHVWDGRYRGIVVSEEKAAQVDRLRYLLSHGVKEGLVSRAGDWPGVHSVRETLSGEPIRGVWFNRTAEYDARTRGESFDRLRYVTEETFELSPLPCLAHLAAEKYRKWVADLVDEIEREAAAERANRGLMPLGITGVLRQDPQYRPSTSKKSPAPLFHAATKAVRRILRAAYSLFAAAFRAAAARWKAGDRTAEFPIGSFPPGVPFVSTDAADPPWAILGAGSREA